jgi:hypothetical protein
MEEDGKFSLYDLLFDKRTGIAEFAEIVPDPDQDRGDLSAYLLFSGGALEELQSAGDLQAEMPTYLVLAETPLDVLPFATGTAPAFAGPFSVRAVESVEDKVIVFNPYGISEYRVCRWVTESILPLEKVLKMIGLS